MCSVSTLSPLKPHCQLKKKSKFAFHSCHSCHDMRNSQHISVLSRRRYIWRCEHTSPFLFLLFITFFFLSLTELKLICEELPYCFLAFSVYIPWQLMSMAWWRYKTGEQTSTPLVECDSGNTKPRAANQGRLLWLFYEHLQQTPKTFFFNPFLPPRKKSIFLAEYFLQFL